MNMKLDNHSSIFLDTNPGDCGSRYVDGYSFIHPAISIQIGITMVKKKQPTDEGLTNWLLRRKI